MRTRITIGLAFLLTGASPALAQVEFVTPPLIRWVGIDTASGNVEIAWSPSPDKDIARYVIYRDSLSAQFAKAVDTVDAGTTRYIHKTPDALKRSLAYTVAAMDSSGNISTYPQSHSTLFLEIVYDTCESRINLTWPHYDPWIEVDSLAGYSLFFSQNSGAFNSLDLPKNPADTNRNHPVVENRNYCYFIEAVHLDGRRRSASNIACVGTNMPRHPDYINADYATITEKNIIKLSFTYDPLGEISTFDILRGKESIEYINLTIAELTGISDNPLVYYDTVAYDTVNYYYRMEAKDVCDRTVTTSNVAGHVVLLAERDTLLVNLEWTPYQEWLGGTGSYSIYRIQINASPDTTLLDSVSYFVNTYSDNLEDQLNQGIEGHFCYFISAWENEGNPYGICGQSRSNTVCVDIIPDVFMPDAFTPDDDQHNDKVGPIFTFDPNTFYFVIYDRWGGKVFETRDKDNRLWDGTVRGGQKAMAGIYTYYIKLTTRSSIIKELRGTINLIYP
jgi:gliding motility-associated-like protein